MFSVKGSMAVTLGGESSSPGFVLLRTTYGGLRNRRYQAPTFRFLHCLELLIQPVKTMSSTLRIHGIKQVRLKQVHFYMQYALKIVDIILRYLQRVFINKEVPDMGVSQMSREDRSLTGGTTKMGRSCDDTIQWKRKEIEKHGDQVKKLIDYGWGNEAIANYIGMEAHTVKRFRDDNAA